MDSVLPTWFKYRQGKAELVGEHLAKLTAPNLPDAFIGIRAAGDGKWQGYLRATADGPDTAAAPPECVEPNDAWSAAFELYRTHIVLGPAE